MEKRMFFIGITLLVFAAIPALPGPEDDPGSVYDYNINWVVQTGSTEITVQLQARYCPACNPNDAGNAGCTPFEHTIPPYGERGCSMGYPDGRYTAVRIKDTGGFVLATTKMVCDSANWPLNIVHTEDFIFPGLPLHAGDLVTIEADAYCSWCGHWYPDPVTIPIVGSDSQTTYTGDTSALVGTNAHVCAVLKDAKTGDPLVGRNVSFTLDTLLPVTAVTNSQGVASTMLPIPGGMAGGTYKMTARFAGGPDYFPSSDTVDFEVIVMVAMKSFLIEKAEIGWAAGTFAISGNFQLPEGYPKADLDRSAVLGIQIAGAVGTDEVAFMDLGQAWAYMEGGFNNRSGQGINITKFDISWSYLANSFSIKGDLSLPGVGPGTLPREAAVSLQLGGAPPVVGEATIGFEKQDSVWYYGSAPGNNEPIADNPTGQWDFWLDEPSDFEDPGVWDDPWPGGLPDFEGSGGFEDMWLGDMLLYFEDSGTSEDPWFSELLWPLP
jgi:hypothetical protein